MTIPLVEASISSIRPFDQHADAYAAAWESDPTARAWRLRVHRLLSRLLAPGSRVLDVGCGPGADAAWLSAAGHEVVAIDASSRMAALARVAAPRARVEHRPAEEVGALASGRPFDAALLNFGVANAVDLRRVAQGLALCLRDDAPVVVVTMPRVNPAWTLGALRRGRWRAALARAQARSDVPVEDSVVPTRYLGPEGVAAAMWPWLTVESSAALGLVSPPPGSSGGWSDGARSALDRLDRGLSGLPGLRGIGDHVAVVLRRRPEAALTPPRRSLPGRVASRLRARTAGRSGDVDLRLLILEATTGCASRCVGCGYRGPAGGEALTPERAGQLATEARARGATEALITGGEPLLRRDLEALLDAVRAPGLAVTLLTSGLGLRRRAEAVAARCERVVISLDGADAARYRAARGVDGFGAVAAGVAALRRTAARLPVTARVTVTAHNAGDLVQIADRARSWGLDGVSFLLADDWTAGALGRDAVSALPALDLDALRRSLARLRSSTRRSFVLDHDGSLDRILALAEGARPGPPACDAPYTTAFVTADGMLRPCFFLPADGSAAEGLGPALDQARGARAALDVAAHPTCARCVCWATLA